MRRPSGRWVASEYGERRRHPTARSRDRSPRYETARQRPRELWLHATDGERGEIAQNLFTSIRVRVGTIVSAKLAREEYTPLVASAETRVWMARPEGFEPPTY